MDELLTGKTGVGWSVSMKAVCPHKRNGKPDRIEPQRLVETFDRTVTLFGELCDEITRVERTGALHQASAYTDSSERAEARQRAFVQVSCRAGLRHVVKLSQIGADERSPARFMRYHAAIERMILESGMAHTSLRSNLYMQGRSGAP